MKKNPDAEINCIHAIGKNSPAVEEFVSCLKHLAKDIILQSYIAQKDFIISFIYPNGIPGYMLSVFDIRLHQDFSSAQFIRETFEFRPAFPAATNVIGYAHLLTNK